MTIISLEGIASLDGNEDRALAYLKVNLNETEYDWQIYVPPFTDLTAFITESTALIEHQILQKEKEWEELNPKTRIVPGFMEMEEIVVDIQKSEIVKPDIPDYYALRRNKYPSQIIQLAALSKGVNSQEYQDVLKKIEEVKIKYPKPIITYCPENALLGYNAPVRELQENGSYILVSYASHTIEEEKIEWRKVTSIAAWQGRYILSTTAPITEGPLESFPDTSLLNQINKFAEYNFSQEIVERFKGTTTWKRSDPLLNQLASTLNIDNKTVDQWFIDAILVK